MSKFAAFEGQLKKSIEHFKVELSRVRTGRASASLLDGITVDYYGSQTPLKQLGMVNTPEPRLITVQIYDNGAVEAVDKALRSSDLGVNPQRDGNLLRIPIPALTEERRKEMVKTLHKRAEEERVALRNHRRDALEVIKKQKKDKAISEDDARRDEAELQKIFDKANGEVDTLLAAKEKELLAV